MAGAVKKTLGKDPGLLDKYKGLYMGDRVAFSYGEDREHYEKTPQEEKEIHQITVMPGILSSPSWTKEEALKALCMRHKYGTFDPTLRKLVLLGQASGAAWGKASHFEGTAQVAEHAESCKTRLNRRDDWWLRACWNVGNLLCAPGTGLPVRHRNALLACAESLMERLECCQRLSEMQQRAIRLAAQQRVTLVRGPPGTGKTITAVCAATVCNILDRCVGLLPDEFLTRARLPSSMRGALLRGRVALGVKSRNPLVYFCP